MTVNLNGKQHKVFRLKIGRREQDIGLSHGQYLNEESEPGKTLLREFPSYCTDVKEIEEVDEPKEEKEELLVEEPLDIPLEVEKEEDVVEEPKVEKEELPTLESFGKGKEAKLKLEDFGKTLGIDLNKQYSLANMYKQLVEYVEGK